MNPVSNNSGRNLSFPNADQEIPGATGRASLNLDSELDNPINITHATDPGVNQGIYNTTITPQPERRRTVNLAEALDEEKRRGDIAPQNIHTYQSDVVNAIKSDNVSMIKIALAEKKQQDTKTGFDDVLSPEKKISRYYIIAGIVGVLVVLGLLGVYLYFQNQANNDQATEIAKARVPALLYTEIESTVDTTDKDPYEIFKDILLEKNGIMDLGTMKSIITTIGEGTTTVPLTVENFFNVINARTPDILVRALDSHFLLGVYAYNPREMFAIFKVTSYDPAFAGMLEWEPNMPSDIGELFINRKAVIATSSDTTFDESYVAPEEPARANPKQNDIGFINSDKFIDKVVENKDARVLIDTEGKTKMLYTFLDKRTLVISTSDKALKEIIFRLTTGRISR